MPGHAAHLTHSTAGAWRKPVEERHGAACQCLQLLALVGGDPRSMRYGYCVHALRKHWRLTCHHGETDALPIQAAGERWRDLGRTDAVKAILVKNA